MSKNAFKIAEGFRNLVYKPHEIMSGTVVPGSVNITDYTCSVLLTDMETPVDGVMLNTITGNGNGLICFPADNSDVLVGRVDGSGEYFLFETSVLEKVVVNIGVTNFVIDTNGYQLKHNGECLKAILKDTLNKIIAMNVTTSTGPSGPPINAADFSAIITRLDNLLT